MVELRLLGALQIDAPDGRDLSALARQSKRSALLAYLAAALPRGLHRRDTLLALLWPELPASKARAALSQALYVLRNNLGEQAILTRGDEEVGIATNVVWCDVAAFEAGLEAGQLGEALALYRGDLLNGFFVSDAPDFERWIDRERQRLRDRAAEGGWAVAETHAAAEDGVQAARWARRAAALAPADEAVIRRLMTFLTKLGDRASALRAFEAFAETLSRDYELEPSAETLALAEAIRLERQPARTTEPTERAVPSTPRVPHAQSSSQRTGLIGAVVGAAIVILLGLRMVTSHTVGTPDPPIRRIAVLPLENLTRDSTQDYFVDGIHEAIIDELAQIEAVSVISRTSALRFRGSRGTSLPDIARKLGVDAVVEGSVLRAGDSVRVTVQLIDGRTDQHLWANTYLRDLHDVLRLQGELATAIAGQIGSVVTPAEQERLAIARPVDPDVYTLFLKGGYECGLWTEDGLRRGIQLLRRAVDRDPTYAMAYARLAGCYSDLSFFGFAAPGDVNPLAKAAVTRALALDSTLGEAHATLGWIRFVTDLDFAGPDRDFRRALELSPGNAAIVLLYSNYLTLAGRFDEGIARNRRAIELDPLSAPTSVSLGWTYFKARRYDESIAQLHRTLELEPGYGFAYMELAWNYSLKNMDDAAVAHCDSALAQSHEAVTLQSCGWVYGRTGRRPRALEMLRQLTALSHHHWIDPFYPSVIYVGLGDHERAIALLQDAARQHSQDLVFLKVDPWLDPLRSDAEFQALLRELRIAS